MVINHGADKFYIGESENKPLAEICYKSKDENTITVDHTYVSKELRGQSIGKKLIKRLADWAKEEHKKIIPVCPFVKEVMIKNPEYAELIAD